jgi:hypothetical protein
LYRVDAGFGNGSPFSAVSRNKGPLCQPEGVAAIGGSFALADFDVLRLDPGSGLDVVLVGFFILPVSTSS